MYDFKNKCFYVHIHLLLRMNCRFRNESIFNGMNDLEMKVCSTEWMWMWIKILQRKKSLKLANKEKNSIFLYYMDIHL